MAFLRSLLFALIFYPATVLCVLAAFPANLFGNRALRVVTHVWVRIHHWCARHLLGIRTRVEGSLPEGAVLVAAKHQSMYETLELVRLLHEPALVMKRELSDIPLWGWVARSYGIIPVDRDGGAAALRAMMRATAAAIASVKSSRRGCRARRSKLVSTPPSTRSTRPASSPPALRRPRRFARRLPSALLP